MTGVTGARPFGRGQVFGLDAVHGGRQNVQTVAVAEDARLGGEDDLTVGVVDVGDSSHTGHLHQLAPQREGELEARRGACR